MFGRGSGLDEFLPWPELDQLEEDKLREDYVDEEMVDAGEIEDHEVENQQVQHEEVQHEEVQHEEVQHEEVQHDEVQHEEVQHEEVQHEEVQDQALEQQQQEDHGPEDQHQTQEAELSELQRNQVRRRYATEENDAIPTESIDPGDIILPHREWLGREYPNFSATSEYWAPVDEKQCELMRATHQMFKVVMDSELCWAPIDDYPERVLDIGTGTGDWAIEFADRFPEAQVIATDLAEIIPEPAFEIPAFQSFLVLIEDSYDYVHIRCLMGCIEDWPELYGKVYQSLKPGGWFEHIEYSFIVRSDDNSIPHGSPWINWGMIFKEAGDESGKTFQVIEDDRNIEWLEQAGFENINSHHFKIPIGDWSFDLKEKEVGRVNREIMFEAVEGYFKLIATDILGISIAEMEIYLMRIRRDIIDRSIHAYFEGSAV
ncbi:hypothetical protein G7046_g8978 [Stylonectria norvegica]|nr:hypothetical protein G7046_g8978 [Stylonectria norvegica]